MQQRNGSFWKDPLIFLDILLQQWTQLRNRHFRKVPPNILEGLEVHATAERMFWKDPLIFFGSVVIQMWMQLRNRGFPKDPMKI